MNRWTACADASAASRGESGAKGMSSAAAILANRWGEISAMSSIDGGSVMHEDTPWATSHRGPSWWLSACESPSPVLNPP